MQVNGLYLYWNKALFAEAGLDPGQAPQTFEELAEYAVKLSDPEQNRYGLGLPASGAPEYYVSFIRGNGGEVVNRENMTSALNSPENVKTFQWLQDLAVNKRVSPIGASGADLEKLMQSGQLAMLINGPWMAAGLKDNGIDFGVALPPKGSVRQSTVLGAVGFAIPRNTSPEEKEAVYDFLAYWNSKEIGKKWSLEVGFPPYLHSVIEDPEVQADPFVSVMADMSDAARPYLNGLVGAGENSQRCHAAIDRSSRKRTRSGGGRSARLGTNR